jgi:hypothetical protein
MENNRKNRISIYDTVEEEEERELTIDDMKDKISLNSIWDDFTMNYEVDPDVPINNRIFQNYFEDNNRMAKRMFTSEPISPKIYFENITNKQLDDIIVLCTRSTIYKNYENEINGYVTYSIGLLRYSIDKMDVEDIDSYNRTSLTYLYSELNENEYNVKWYKQIFDYLMDSKNFRTVTSPTDD